MLPVPSRNPDTIRSKIAILRDHCETLGRDPGEIVVSTGLEDIHLLAPGEDPAKASAWTNGQVSRQDYEKRYTIVTADQISSRIEQIVEAGADYIIVYLAGLAFNFKSKTRIPRSGFPHW